MNGSDSTDRHPAAPRPADAEAGFTRAPASRMGCACPNERDDCSTDAAPRRIEDRAGTGRLMLEASVIAAERSVDALPRTERRALDYSSARRTCSPNRRTSAAPTSTFNSVASATIIGNASWHARVRHEQYAGSDAGDRG